MAFEFGEAAQAVAYFIKAVKRRPASPEEKSEGESFPKESPAALKGLQNKSTTGNRGRCAGTGRVPEVCRFASDC